MTTSEAPTYETLNLDVDEGVGVITLNRPEAMNALNMRLKEELAGALRESARRADVRCVLLTGAGRAFCAGGDITEMDPNRGPAAIRQRHLKLLREVVVPLARMEKPVVAAVNGHAHGIGLSLALACDVAYAAESAVFSLAFARVGLIPDGAAIFFLPRLTGMNRAKELVFSARRFGAAEALDLGLVNRVVADEELLAAAREFARTLATGPTAALGMAKRLLDQSPALSLEEAVELEAFGQAVAMSSEDHAEGIKAFQEKRTAEFTGR